MRTIGSNPQSAVGEEGPVATADAEGAPESDRIRRASCGGLLGRVPGRRAGLVVLLCVVVALLLDLVFFAGFYGSDCNTYLVAARMIADGARPDAHVPGTIRLAFVLPMAAIIVSGAPLAAVNLVFIAYHLMLIVLVYLLGRTLHNPITGVVAAALAAVCPPCVIFASMPLPDIPMACFVVGAMVLVAASAKALGTDRMGRAMVLAFVGGGVLMLGCTAKISAAVVAPVFVGYLAISGGRRLKPAVGLSLGFVGGFLLVFAIDAGILHLSYRNVATGRFDQVIRRHQPSTHSPAKASAPRPTKDSTHSSLRSRPRVELPDRARTVARNLRWMLGSWYAVLLAGSVLAYPLLRRRSWFLFAVFLWGILYRTYGSGSALRYAPQTLQSRYFLVYVVMACVMSGFLVAIAWQTVQEVRRHKRLAVVAAVALFAAGGGWTLVESIRTIDVYPGLRYSYPTLQGVREALALAKTAFPCWTVVVQPKLHWTAWSLYRTSDVSSWLVPSVEKVVAGRSDRPAEFLYLCYMGKERRSARSDELLECGLGVRSIYSRQGFVIQQERIGRFSIAKSRIETIRYELLGGLLPSPERIHSQVVHLWKVVIRPQGFAGQVSGESDPPRIRNGGFEQWVEGKPVGWSAAGGAWDDLSKAEPSSLAGGIAISLDTIPGDRFRMSVYQDIALDPSLAGQHLVVSADGWAAGEHTARLSVEILHPVRCTESVFHPGDARWHTMRASIGVPLDRRAVLARIRLWREQPWGATMFDNAEASVEPVAGAVGLAEAESR